MSSNMDFFIGGMAGAGATIFTNPMDVVKIRLQLQGELRARNETVKKYRGGFHAMYVIAKTDGLFALQRGLAPAMVLGFCLNSVRLGSYRYADTHGFTRNETGQLVFHKAILSAGVCGLLGGISCNPPSVVKTRIQAQSHPDIAVGKQHNYKSFWHGCKTIYRKEGLAGYYTGLNATCARMVAGSCAQLPTFSKAKEAILNLGYCKDSPFILAYLASCISGVAVSVCLCPFDVVAVRLYNQGKSSDGKLLYTGVIDCFTKILRKEGFFGLYKGLGPLYLRLAPHTTLSLVIWDVVSNLISAKRINS